MAEQRKIEFVVEPTDIQLPEINEKKAETIQPELPINRLKKITNLEKIILLTLALFFVVLSALTIQLSNRVAKYEENITTMQRKNESINGNVSELQQEKTELSRVDKLNKEAKKEGLEKTEDNIRNVTE